MNEKIIGVSLRITSAENYKEIRDSISHDLVLFLQKLNLIPILIPNVISNIPEFLNEVNISGIILSGGDNLGDYPLRDESEIKILDYAISKKIPTIGICRGMQVINSFFGGKTKRSGNTTHVSSSHKIELTERSFFDNQRTIIVNSYHNNIINSNCIGKDLIPFAYSKLDDTIEGFTHNEFPITGVMWHPERKPTDESSELFKKIFK